MSDQVLGPDVPSSRADNGPSFCLRKYLPETAATWRRLGKTHHRLVHDLTCSCRLRLADSYFKVLLPPVGVYLVMFVTYIKSNLTVPRDSDHIETFLLSGYVHEASCPTKGCLP